MRHDRYSANPGLAVCGLLILLLAAGCHSLKKTPRTDPPPVAASEIPATPVQRSYTVISFEGIVEGINLNGQVRVAQDSAIWLSVTKLIEVGRAMCTPDSLWLRAPMLGRDDALDYPTFQRLSGKQVSYDELQDILLADDVEQRIAALARQLGYTAQIRLLRRREVDHLSFPYTKPVNQ